MSGLFITFEGPEGSGKTTAAKLVAQYFNKKGIPVLLTREPGGIQISEDIRNIILDPKNTSMDYKTEALLYAAARRQHLVEKIIPALNDNYLVICDRFVDSSLVYQGIARKLGIDEIYEINKFAINDLLPKKTIFFNLDYKIGLERINKNNREKNRLDLENNKFHEMVYNGYLEICDKFSERIIKIDASKDIDYVAKNVIDIIEKLL